MELGKLINGNAERDAVHVAIVPVIANERLKPGEHIGFVKTDRVTVGKVSNTLGIVDPFLKVAVNKGQQFYMCLYPNTVIGMKHHWLHPAFDENAESMRWLTEFAKQFNWSYDQLIDAGYDMLKNEGYCFWDDDHPEEFRYEQDNFWKHFHNVTGMIIPDYDEFSYRCAC